MLDISCSYWSACCGPVRLALAVQKETAGWRVYAAAKITGNEKIKPETTQVRYKWKIALAEVTELVRELDAQRSEHGGKPVWKQLDPVNVRAPGFGATKALKTLGCPLLQDKEAANAVADDVPGEVEPTITNDVGVAENALEFSDEENSDIAVALNAAGGESAGDGTEDDNGSAPIPLSPVSSDDGGNAAADDTVTNVKVTDETTGDGDLVSVDDAAVDDAAELTEPDPTQDDPPKLYETMVKRGSLSKAWITIVVVGELIVAFAEASAGNGPGQAGSTTRNWTTDLADAKSVFKGSSRFDPENPTKNGWEAVSKVEPPETMGTGFRPEELWPASSA